MDDLDFDRLLILQLEDIGAALRPGSWTIYYGFEVRKSAEGAVTYRAMPLLSNVVYEKIDARP